MSPRAFRWAAPVVLTAISVLAWSGCGLFRRSAAPPDALAANLDPTVNPGEDFFTYANGGWLKRNPIPPSESSWGIGNVVEDQIDNELRTMSQSAAASHAAAGSDGQKIGDFWSTAMDEGLAARLGVTPLQPQLTQIAAVQTPAAALDAAFALRPLGVAAFFGFAVTQDDKNSAQMAVRLSQGGLGLPNRDFYFNSESGVARIRREYVAHLGRLLQLLGENQTDAGKSAAAVMAFETGLAKASRKLADMRDPRKNYNRMTPAELTANDTPSIDWTARLGTWDLHPAAVVVGQPEFFAALDALLAQTPAPVLREYLRLRLVSAYSDYLSPDFGQESFQFRQVMTGQQEERPRWKRVLTAENSAEGMVLGRLYVQKYFPPRAKVRYTAMVEAIRSAYAARIERLDWMSAPTKTKALQKLAAVTPKVGYPDKWKDDSALVIGRDSYAANMMNAAQWRFHDEVSKFGKPVDRTEWDMTPQTYNAYYNPSNNEIVLPAAMFIVPGESDDQLDDALMYGYVGASTIGHEMTHGFDDEGRQYDAAGNLADWWTKQDATQFQRRAKVMVEQFNAYEPLPGLHINGAASLGENIADYGGILLGIDAFEKTKQFKDGKSINGLTPMQRYFLGYALGWLEQDREAVLRRALLSDVHAPAKWRVNGPFSNLPAFYQAFGVQPGQPMWRPPAARVQIW